MKKGRRPRRRPRLKLSDKAGPDQCPVPGENALFPAQIAGFLAVSRPVPVYPVFLNYVVPVHRVMLMRFQRLEDLRIDADKTQEEIANILDCKREVYRRYEKGVYEIPVWALIKLSEYYQVSTDYILGLTDEKK